ncbi:MAG: DUF1015 domain-containing protein [Solobacterium sp.]|nr:DUF1015 domain-containing protein [Solobacterium sp.]
MTGLFVPGTFLIPEHCDLSKWSVIACDQYTSEPEYWQKAEALVGSAPSSLRCILPEAYLSETDLSLIEETHSAMLKYLNENLFREYPDSYIYIERSLQDGRVRRGILGCIDLEAYEYTDNTEAAVRATEKTVPERIPPRMAVRKDAPLEFSHVLLLCDDEKKQIIEGRDPSSMPLLYDFDLMLNGGHIRGWLVSGSEKEKLEAELRRYETEKAGRLIYAVGDGNHSLASAKVLYEESGRDPALRYACTELNNIRDDSYTFEPIHRIVQNADTDDLTAFLRSHEQKGGTEIPFLCGGRETTLSLPVSKDSYTLKVLQDLLDQYLEDNPGEIDYIHGEEHLRSLCGKNTAGFVLPPLSADSFFANIEKNGAYCRKAFSIGEADDKRFYLECRKLKNL